jgi:hypothetical protein
VAKRKDEKTEDGALTMVERKGGVATKNFLLASSSDGHTSLEHMLVGMLILKHPTFTPCAQILNKIFLCEVVPGQCDVYCSFNVSDFGISKDPFRRLRGVLCLYNRGRYLHALRCSQGGWSVAMRNSLAVGQE